MGLKAMLDSVDELPEEIKSHYTEDNGKFVLDIEGIDDHPKVRGVVTANKTNKETRDRLKTELEQLKQRIEGLPEDFDAEAYEELKQAADGKGGKLSDEEMAELRNRLEAKIEKKYKDKYDPEIAARDETIGKLDGAIKRMTVDDGLSKAMDEADIDPKHKSVLLPFLKTQAKIDIKEDGESYAAEVETDMGPMSLSKWVSEWAGSDAGKPYVAKPTGPDPKGGNRSGIRGKTVTREQFNAMSHPERKQTIDDGIKVVDAE